MLINCIGYTKSESDLFLPEIFKTNVYTPEGYFVLKKLVWNISIKAFWYTKKNFHNEIEKKKNLYKIEQ